MARDPEATKARILDAALHEFSAKGIAGARVDAIAAHARVNKRMLYYYFGSKENLFREVRHRRLVGRERDLRTSGTVDLPMLGERQEQTFDDRAYVRLLMWEALEAPGHASNSTLRHSFYQAWVDAVAAEQAAGAIDPDLDPAQLVLSEIMLVLGPVMLPQITKLVTGKSVGDPEFLAQRKQFLDRLEERYHATVRARD